MSGMDGEKKHFNMVTRKQKAGEITILKAKVNGFRSASISGKVKVPKQFSNDDSLHNFIKHLGLKFLRLFPDLFIQGKNQSIISISLVPFKTSRPYRVVNFDFAYKIKDGVDDDAVFKGVFSKLQSVNDEISAYMKEDIS